MSEPAGRDRNAVVVTGASRGIGAALARAFLEDDRPVFGIDRDDPDAGLAGEAAYNHARADIVDEAALDAAFDAAWSRGPVAAVFANAAVTDMEHRRAVDLDYAAWQRVLRINVDGAFLTGRLAGRRMLAQGFGSIVFVTSSLARLDQARAEDAPYCTSKAAVEMFAKVLSLELGPQISVNTLYPSVKIDTGFFAHLAREERQALAAPDILNRAARFLASLPPGGLTGHSLDQERWDSDADYRRSLAVRASGGSR
jgi:NAD(P)-dependent dehydrogenase (short-subunit alcohol dehydrogenase family)